MRGSAWEIMACVDRLKELREITEISGSGAMVNIEHL